LVVAPATADLMARMAHGLANDLAATALLIHVISLDGEPSEAERRKLHTLIELRFGLDPGSADRLIAQAMLEFETLSGEEITELLAKGKLDRPDKPNAALELPPVKGSAIPKAGGRKVAGAVALDKAS